jgi:hypothetical protein
MKTTAFAAVGLFGMSCLWFSSSGAMAETCAPTLTESIRVAKTAADTLITDTPATRSELLLIDDACRRGKDVEAAWRLEQVQAHLEVTRLGASARRRCHATLRLSGACSLTADARTGSRTMNVEPTPSRLSATTSP